MPPARERPQNDPPIRLIAARRIRFCRSVSWSMQAPRLARAARPRKRSTRLHHESPCTRRPPARSERPLRRVEPDATRGVRRDPRAPRAPPDETTGSGRPRARTRRRSNGSTAPARSCRRRAAARERLRRRRVGPARRSADVERPSSRHAQTAALADGESPTPFVRAEHPAVPSTIVRRHGSEERPVVRSLRDEAKVHRFRLVRRSEPEGAGELPHLPLEQSPERNSRAPLLVDRSNRKYDWSSPDRRRGGAACAGDRSRSRIA